MLVEIVPRSANPPALVPAVHHTVEVKTETDGVQAPQNQVKPSDQQLLSAKAEEAQEYLQAQQTAAPTGQSGSTVITCVSKPGERQVCKADTAAGVALLRSTGDPACLLGKNWGYDDAGVWVSGGCGGEFAVGGTREASGLSKFVGMFEPYGQLRTHLAAYQDQAEVQNNASRIGINFSTRGKIKMFAGTEWGVNLVQSETQFNLSGSGSGGALGSVQTITTPVFTARLGFIGTDFGRFGQVSIGKQYGMQYDVAGYTTDRFNVFGGQGTFAYVAGTSPCTKSAIVAQPRGFEHQSLGVTPVDRCENKQVFRLLFVRSDGEARRPSGSQ
jgi:hypothetical protein